MAAVSDIAKIPAERSTSCASLDPVTTVCSDLNPIALKTSQGDLYIFGSYVVDTTDGGNQPYSINWGISRLKRPAKRSDLLGLGHQLGGSGSNCGLWCLLGQSAPLGGTHAAVPPRGPGRALYSRSVTVPCLCLFAIVA